MNKNKQPTLWSADEVEVIPASASTVKDIVPYARQLTKRDVDSIVTAFETQNYEMMVTFVWSRAVAALKKQVATLGAEFVGEVLSRPDISEDSDIISAVSDYEAISLAEDLGMLTPTDGLRMRQSLELISHFASLGFADRGEEEMHCEEAVGILRTCVKSVLAQPSVDVAVKFAEFRKGLEARSFGAGDPEVAALVAAPYFFKKTTNSMLLALLRTAQGAQLEHVIGNINLLVPAMWPTLKGPERWQVGKAYAELSAEGKKKAAVGLKNALVKVAGFDYVPETLRSNTFAAAAQDILEAHDGLNNFYKETAPMRVLKSLGTAIPKPAFPVCMTAILSVRLGNQYGRSWEAQSDASAMLSSLRPEQWEYFLNECLAIDRRLLGKLTQSKPVEQWIELCGQENISGFTIKDPVVRKLVTSQPTAVKSTATRQLITLGRKA